MPRIPLSTCPRGRFLVSWLLWPGVGSLRTGRWESLLPGTFPPQKVKVKSLSCVRLFATPWTVAYQAPPSMGFSRQSAGVDCHFLLRGSSRPESNPGLLHCRQTLYHLSHREALAQFWLCCMNPQGLSFFLYKMGTIAEPASPGCKDERRQYFKALQPAHRCACHSENM